MTFEKHWKIVILLAGAALLRLAVLGTFPHHLSQDPDAYVELGRHLAAGHGYVRSEAWEPTAYRPPLYPLLLAALFKFGGGPLAIGGLHIVLGTVTVWLTLLCGRALDLKNGAWVAAGFVAIDPLLLWYTSLPMTEVLCGFLLIGFLWSLVSGKDSQRPLCEAPAGRQWAVGLFFGLAALCRPTIWAFGLLAFVWWAASLWNARRKQRHSSADSLPGKSPSLRNIPLWTVVAVLLTIGPWGIRNGLVFGKPILTTTHGGYTLLLANNPVFYDEVVRQPWGTVWDGESLHDWQDQLEREMGSAITPVQNETQRDRWMYDRAWRNIGNDVRGFLMSCGLRFVRFWNVLPLGPQAETVSPWIRWGVGLLYSGLFGAVLWALIRFRRNEWSRWGPVLLLIVGFSLVHLLYWSNARMRAPLSPAIGLLAARGIRRADGDRF